MGRELSLLAKAQEDVEPGWLKGGFPCLCCHLAQRAVHLQGSRGCSSALGFSQDRRISQPQEATQKICCSHFLCPSTTRSFILNRVLVKCCEYKLCCHDHTQGVCAASCATCAHRTYSDNQVDQFIEVKIAENVPKHGRISLST